MSPSMQTVEINVTEVNGCYEFQATAGLPRRTYIKFRYEYKVREYMKFHFINVY